MEIITILTSVFCSLLVALFAYIGTIKQVNATITAANEQMKSSLEIAKLNIKGKIIFEQKQKWLNEIAADISELLAKSQSLSDIIKTVIQNKDDPNEGVQLEMSEQIRKYMDLTEYVLYLTNRIAIKLNDEIPHHQKLYLDLHNLMIAANEVDFKNPNKHNAVFLNTTCFNSAREFIKFENVDILKEL